MVIIKIENDFLHDTIIFCHIEVSCTDKVVSHCYWIDVSLYITKHNS